MILQTGKETVLVISDIQAPFHHKDALPFLDTLKKKIKPTRVIAIGDTVDHYMLGDYPHDPDADNVTDEQKKALKFLKELYQIFPDSVELESNHNVRIFKKASGAGIPATYLKDYAEMFDFPKGWSLAESVVIDGVKYEHGHLHGGAQAAYGAAITNMCSTVIGHFHSYGGIQYIANQQKMIFAMNVGCLIDIHSYAFKYAKGNKRKPTLGTGVVTKGVPHWYPLLLDKKERWTGGII